MKRQAEGHGAPRKRCAIYTRKSTSIGLEQEFNSLDAQREACLAFIASRPEWRALDDSYDDGGFTGANVDRPAFQRLLADVDAHRVDVVVVYKVDRLSRSLLDFVKVMERLTAADVSFVSITQNFSTADAMGRLTLNMLMSFAEFEREMIAERTRDKMCAARRKGKWTGGPIPFGYDVKNKHLIINEPEAAIVRQAFQLLLEYRQPALIAQLLTERGHLPRPAAGVATRRPWNKFTIARLLQNPVYAGFVKCGVELRPGEQAPIITLEMHQRARVLLATRPRGQIERHGNSAYFLKGLLRCARCKGALVPGSTRRDGRVYRYYRCNRREKLGQDGCEAKPVRASALEDHVIDRVGEACTQNARAPAGEATNSIDGVLANFTQTWLLVPAANRGTVLRALVDHLVVDTLTGRVELHLFDSNARAPIASETPAQGAA